MIVIPMPLSSDALGSRLPVLLGDPSGLPVSFGQQLLPPGLLDQLAKLLVGL